MRSKGHELSGQCFLATGGPEGFRHSAYPHTPHIRLHKIQPSRGNVVVLRAIFSPYLSFANHVSAIREFGTQTGCSRYLSFKLPSGVRGP